MVSINRKRAVVVALLCLALAGCASQPFATSSATVPGFWWGLLHGFIAPFSLIGSFFDPEIRAYATPNSGWWYDLGFVFGVSAVAGGSRST